MKRKRKTWARGLTLVETVLAIGIIAVAIVPVIGVLGVALTTLRDSSEETSRAAIVNFVNSDLRARMYGTNSYSLGCASNILTSANTTYYFDAQGNWVSTGTASDSSRILYSATPSGTASGKLIQYNVKITWPYPANANTKFIPSSLFCYE